MATIKEYNNKLKSLKNTQKITKTMKMVAASKLRKAQDAQSKAKQYAHTITHLISRISASVDRNLHPLLQDREQSTKALILVYTSDKGLCGAFNHNAHKQVLTWIEKHGNAYEKIDISCCGKKGYQFFSKRQNVRTHYDDVITTPHFEDAARIGQDFTQFFLNNDYDEIYMAYNQFLSPISQKTIFEKILPIDPHALVDEVPEANKDYLFEPNTQEALNYLVPHFLYFKIYFALLENSAGEHGARMSAMDNATKNASELIDKYTLLRNRARQAAITTELIEIVAGAEALN